MKRFITFLLIPIYLLIAIGLSVSISFCGKKVIEIRFFGEANYCCKKPKKCCSKVNLSFELKENVKPIDYRNLKTGLKYQTTFFPFTFFVNSLKKVTDCFVVYPKLSKLFNLILFDQLYIKYRCLKMGNLLIVS